MSEFQGLYEKIRDIAFDTRRAINNTAAPGAFIERAKNVLYNNMDAIENALKYAVESEKTIRVLEIELADAESEIDELSKPKTTQKAKKTRQPENE